MLKLSSWRVMVLGLMFLACVQVVHAQGVDKTVIEPGEDGFYAITQSSIKTSPTQVGDIYLSVRVERAWLLENEQPKPILSTKLGSDQAFEFDIFLGYLAEGDRVIVESKNQIDNQTVTLTDMMPVSYKYKITRQTAIPVSVLHEDISRTWQKSTIIGPWKVLDLVSTVPTKQFPRSWKAQSDKDVTLHLGDDPKDPTTRFARVTYPVPQSGTYALHDAWVEAQGTELEIHVEGQSKPLRRFKLDGRTNINTDLGYIAKGQCVVLKFKCLIKATDVKLDATVVEWAVRRAPLRVRRGEDGLLDVYEPNAPRKAIDIPSERWITVKPMTGDATQVIRQAIMDAAKTQQGDNYVGVRLERGKTYTVASDQIGGNLFEIKETQRLVFDGNGATMVMNSPEIQRKGINLFTVNASKKVVLADLIVTGDLLPFAEGIITNVTPEKGHTQTVTFKLKPGSAHPINDIARSRHAHGYAYDPHIAGRLAEGVWSFFPAQGDQNLKPTDKPDVFEMKVTRTNGTIKTGFKWLIKNKRAGTLYLVTRGGSEDVTMWKFDCQASGGGLLRNWATDAINILDTKLVPVGDRTISTTSDGIHGRGREGVWVENLTIAGICEDIMNTYARTLAVKADDNPDDNVISLFLNERHPKARNTRQLRKLSQGDMPHVGDKLMFFNPVNGQVLGYAVVQIVDGDRYTLSSTIPGLDAWEKGSEPRATMVYNMRAASRFVVRDSIFANSMRYAVYIKAPHAMIFNNRFEGLASPPIFAANEPGWPEGPPPSHLWIQGNTFDMNNFSYMSRNRAFLNVDPAYISVYTRRYNTKEDPPDHRAYITRNQFANSNIKIIGNTFANWRGMGISIRNARNVQIRDNRFLTPLDDQVMRKTLTNTPSLTVDGKGVYTSIYLDSVNGVVIEDNVYEGLSGNDSKIIAEEDVTHVVGIEK